MQGTYRRRWSNIALFDFGFKKLFYGVGCWRNIRDSSHWQRKVILKTKLQRFSIRHTLMYIHGQLIILKPILSCFY